MPSNITEGPGRQSHTDFGRFLAIAHGSLGEVGTQLMTVGRLRSIDEPKRARFTD